MHDGGSAFADEVILNVPLISTLGKFFLKIEDKRIYITDSLRLDKTQIWIRDEAVDEDGKYVFGNPDKIHHKLKRVTYCKGWISYEKVGINLRWLQAGLTKVEVKDDFLGR